MTNADGTWAEYLTPSEVTGPIADIGVCFRTQGAPEGDVTLEMLVPGREDADPGARDVLLAIEGGTGDKGEDGQPASQSLMAVALLRATTDDRYEVHIAFRGSRSGSGLRAALGALSTEEAEGNPDWITDLGTRFVDAPDISTVGQVFRGMSTSARSIRPQLLACLDRVAGPRGIPDHVYVTGHSLGGGLAQQFASSVLLGDAFGPDGDDMPASLVDWPWQQLKLVTFGSPRVGDEDWARAMTEALDSQYFVNAAGSRWDVGAIGVTDLEIIPRLTDPDRPAAYRVLIPTDPITAEAGTGARHVGQSVYLEVPTAADAGELPNFDDHEPSNERALMLETLRDPRLPELAWRYREMTEINPGRVEDEAGTEAEYRRLAEAVRTYYDDGDLWFAREAFDDTFEVFLDLLPAP